MRVAAFQFDVRTGDVAQNLRAVEEGLRLAGARGLALVVLPEMWPTSFTPACDARLLAESERAVARVTELSRDLGLVVCGSTYGRTEVARCANRLHVLDRGEALATYDKVHLFSPTGEEETFAAGTAPPRAVDTSSGRLAGAVCYDLRFPELTRAAFRAGAEVLALPAQWPTPRASHWRALCIGRAVENQCFVVAANRTGRGAIGRAELDLAFPGNSLVVDPSGRALAEGRGEAGLVEAEIDLAAARALREQVPVARDQRPELYARWGFGAEPRG